MRHLVLSFCSIFLLGAFNASAAAHKECGDVTIAALNWQSAEVLGEIDKIILSVGYGCKVEMIAGTEIATLTSMAEKGSPDVSPEAWVDLQPEIVKRGLAEGRIVALGNALSNGAIQGLYVPSYVVEANPHIKTITDALKHPELFPSPDDPSKGAIFYCCAGSASAVVTRQFFKAYRAEESGFELVDPGSMTGHDVALARAYERREGWLGYYWDPTSTLGRYEMIRLDHGVPFDASEWTRCTSVDDCPDPKPNAWPKDTVLTVVTSRFAKDGGAAVEYLRKRNWPNNTVSAVMAWMTDNQATGLDGAVHFLRSNEDMWTKWVPNGIADNIRKHLN